MKKNLTAVLAGCLLALVMVAAPAGAASNEELLRGEMTLSIVLTPNCPTDPNCFWSGYLSGDIVGTIEIHEVWEYVSFPGLTEHFSEVFRIQVGSEWITGVDEGVWNGATLKFRANGWVSDASAGLAYLKGYKLHEMGTTTDPNVNPVLGTASWFLVAP